MLLLPPEVLVGDGEADVVTAAVVLCTLEASEVVDVVAVEVVEELDKELLSAGSMILK